MSTTCTSSHFVYMYVHYLDYLPLYVLALIGGVKIRRTIVLFKALFHAVAPGRFW